MKKLLLISAIISTAVNATPPPAPSFDFGAMSQASGQLAGRGNTSAHVESGAKITTSSFLIPTPHGITANSITTGSSWGSSYSGEGSTGQFGAGYSGGSSITGTLPFHPLNTD